MTLNLCLLPLGSRLKTRDGRSARLLATDVRGEYPCVVSVESRNSSDDVYTVNGDGRHTFDEDGDRDIVAVEKPKHRVRVVIHKQDMSAEAWVLEPGEDTAGYAGYRVSTLVADRIVEIEEGFDVP